MGGHEREEVLFSCAYFYGWLLRHPGWHSAGEVSEAIGWGKRRVHRYLGAGQEVGLLESEESSESSVKMAWRMRQ
jgi:DNA-binding IclR family transcriptional regulator